jgi:hypothetical protein
MALTDSTTCGVEGGTKRTWVLAERVLVLREPRIEFRCERSGKSRHTVHSTQVETEAKEGLNGKKTHPRPTGGTCSHGRRLGPYSRRVGANRGQQEDRRGACPESFRDHEGRCLKESEGDKKGTRRFPLRCRITYPRAMMNATGYQPIRAIRQWHSR